MLLILYLGKKKDQTVSHSWSSLEPQNHSSGKDSESNKFVFCKITLYNVFMSSTNPRNLLTLKTNWLTY